MNINLSLKTLYVLFSYIESSGKLEEVINKRFHKDGNDEDFAIYELLAEKRKDLAFDVAENLCEDLHKKYDKDYE